MCVCVCFVFVLFFKYPFMFEFVFVYKNHCLFTPSIIFVYRNVSSPPAPSSRTSIRSTDILTFCPPLSSLIMTHVPSSGEMTSLHRVRPRTIIKSWSVWPLEPNSLLFLFYGNLKEERRTQSTGRQTETQRQRVKCLTSLWQAVFH